MRKAGGIIAVVAGAFGVVAAFITVFIGGIAVELELVDVDAETVDALALMGLFLSLVVTGLGAATIASRGRLCSILLVIASIAAAMLCSMLVAMFMALAAIGGIVAFFDPKKPVPTTS